jgi:CheY-like chemotaxis protein/HPt (histidine-containing phosphotransfer) domain-containing protein
MAIDTGKLDIAPFSQRRTARGKRLSFDGRVLVAEDNLVNREVVTGILESMGLHVVTAPNGRVAVEVFSRELFDAVLMDCEMPIVDGLEATRRMRECESLRIHSNDPKAAPRQTPIVALTAHALIDVRERCLRAGMNDFLTKPFNDIQMGEVLRRWLKPVNRETAAPLPLTESTAPALDARAFLETSAFQGSKGRARLHKIMSLFLAEAPALVTTIHEMHAEGDKDSLWRAAHSLKSSSAAIGALRLAERSATIESVARGDGVDAVTQHLSALDAELTAANDALTAFLERAKADA